MNGVIPCSDNYTMLYYNKETGPPLYGMSRKHTCEKKKTTKSRAYAPSYSYCFISEAKSVSFFFFFLTQHLYSVGLP